MPDPAVLTILLTVSVLAGLFFFLVRDPAVLRVASGFLKERGRASLSLLCACALSTMVISGALVAGDSLEESITQATYDNLGEVDITVSSPGLFHPDLVDRLQEDALLMEDVDKLAPIFYLTATVENPGTGERSHKTKLIAFDQDFLDFGKLEARSGERLDAPPGSNSLYLNHELAEELGLRKGGQLSIRLSDPGQSREALFLGEEDGGALQVQLVVEEVVKDEGLGRFQPNAKRTLPQTIYLNFQTLSSLLGREDVANTILVSNRGGVKDGAELCELNGGRLATALDQALTHQDVGLELSVDEERGHVSLGSEDIFFSHIYYDLLSSDPSLKQKTTPISPVLSYFWNRLSFGNRSVPYSTVTALDVSLDTPFGPFLVNESGEEFSETLAPDEIILNNWTAEELGVQAGDRVNMNFSVLARDYRLRDEEREFTVKAVVELSGKAANPGFMPSFPGIEGVSNPNDWDPPFDIELEKIRPQDEEYWEDYGGTPKAFVSLETGTNLWGSDTGNLTQLRVKAAPGVSLEELRGGLATVLDQAVGREEAGLTVDPVKEKALASVEGVEIFTQMFLAFSAVIVLAALILIALLLSVSVEERSSEIGVLRTLGFTRARLRSVFLLEGLALSTAGSLLGALGGLLFAAFLVGGLNSFWSPVVEGARVGLSFRWESLVLAFATGVLVSLVTVGVVVFQLTQRTVVANLRKERKDDPDPQKHMNKVPKKKKRENADTAKYQAWQPRSVNLLVFGFMFGFLFLFVGGGLLFTWQTMYHLSPFYVFFESGLFYLIGFLGFLYFLLIYLDESSSQEKQDNWLLMLSLRNISRKPWKTLATMLLFAITLFSLVALSINLQGIVHDQDELVEEGGGGFDIMAESTGPLPFDLSDREARQDAGVYSDVFDELEIQQFRTHGGVGGTCSNLNPEATPRLVSVNDNFFDNKIPFAENEKLRSAEDSPWELLIREQGDGAIPVIGDYNTVVWVLELKLGDSLFVLDGSGRQVELRIVGLTRNSIFQGSLLLWDRHYDRLYPTDPGYDLFLFKSDSKSLKADIQELESSLADFGLDAYTVESVVLEQQEVENSYITIFQFLLFLALLIGTAGFGLVVSQNIQERQQELGILRSLGFSKKMIFKQLFLENSLVALGGILAGTLAGLLAGSVYFIRLGLGPGDWPWLLILGIPVLCYLVAVASMWLPLRRVAAAQVSELVRKG